MSAAELAAQDSDQAAQDKRKVAVLMRLTKINVNEKPKLKAAVVRFLKTVTEEDAFLEYAQRFQIPETEDRLWNLLGESENPSNRLKAAELLMRQSDRDSLSKKIVLAKNSPIVIESFGLISSKSSIQLLQSLVLTKVLSVEARNNAVTGLGRQVAGQKILLAMVNSKQLPEDCQFTAANILLGSSDASVKSAASKLMKLPAGLDKKPLSPLNILVKKKGEIANGKLIFAKKGTCANCHKVTGQGKEVGPDLSEIGSKLSRQAMFESILNPNLAVSHNYETYLIQTFDGLSYSGVLVSETDEQVVIRTAEAITREIDKEDIEGMKKSKQSLMPADLQKNFSESDLIDLVEYMLTLTKKK